MNSNMGQSVAGTILSVITALLGFAVVIILAYICTKYIGGKMSFKSSNYKNFEIIEKIPIAADKQLMIVKSAGKVMLIGITAQHIELISELDEEMISYNQNISDKEQDFMTVLKANIEKTVLKSKKQFGKENTDEKQD